MEFIITKKIKIYTKESLKILNIALISFGIIIAILLLKFKPMYEVRVSGKKIGYTENKNVLVEEIQKNITEFSSDSIEKIELKETPEYELKLVNRAQRSNDSEIIIALQGNADITFRENGQEVASAESANVQQNDDTNNSINEASQELSSIETADMQQKDDVNTSINMESQEVASAEAVDIKDSITEIANINGVSVVNLPITGRITSRYGERSSLRKSTHTGLDIAANTGTEIKAVADGTVVFASYNGSYGNLVKLDHGNGVQTWYAHTSKMLVSVGKQVKAGDVIALVGSTGNSTGPHLHFEVRINNEVVNPQNYIYK